MTTAKFNIACINQCTEAEGPEKRLAIWFQGCDKRCADCCNPHLLEIKRANIISLDRLSQIIIEAKAQFDIEGVTYIGGEPTLQQGLAELSDRIREMGLGIILFTGKRFEELNEELKTVADLIVDGGFESNKPNNERNLIGSTNQRLIYTTERYRPFEKWFYDIRPKRVEINILDGLFVTGDKI